MTASLREQVKWQQYDDETLTWANEGDKDSPYRQFIARHVLPFIGDVTGRSVLDVGSGTGWLLHVLGREGARSVTGIEPSRYATLAAELYPEAAIHKETFMDFQTEQQFDLVTLIMSLEVMDDLPGVFQKLQQTVTTAGRIVLCKGDYDYFTADKYDYVLTREEVIPGQETVVRTDRPSGYGTTIDIYRTAERVIDAAAESGLQLTRGPESITPDAEVIQAVPRYADFEGRAIMELLEFKAA